MVNWEDWDDVERMVYWATAKAGAVPWEVLLDSVLPLTSWDEAEKSLVHFVQDYVYYELRVRLDERDEVFERKDFVNSVDKVYEYGRKHTRRDVWDEINRSREKSAQELFLEKRRKHMKDVHEAYLERCSIEAQTFERCPYCGDLIYPELRYCVRCEEEAKSLERVKTRTPRRR